jgi:hypothetical protein
VKPGYFTQATKRLLRKADARLREILNDPPQAKALAGLIGVSDPDSLKRKIDLGSGSQPMAVPSENLQIRLGDYRNTRPYLAYVCKGSAVSYDNVDLDVLMSKRVLMGGLKVQKDRREFREIRDAANDLRAVNRLTERFNKRTKKIQEAARAEVARQMQLEQAGGAR